MIYIYILCLLSFWAGLGVYHEFGQDSRVRSLGEMASQLGTMPFVWAWRIKTYIHR